MFTFRSSDTGEGPNTMRWRKSMWSQGHPLHVLLLCECIKIWHIKFWLTRFRSAAMCSATDESLIDETFKFLLSEARDQDLYMFIANLGSNRLTRRRMAKFTKDNYDEVCAAFYRLRLWWLVLTMIQIYKRFSGNTQLQHLIAVSQTVLRQPSLPGLNSSRFSTHSKASLPRLMPWT